MPEQILIATSIAPNDRLAIQRDAVQSWKAAGFSVVSCNIQSEIEKLRPQFPETTFHAIDRNGALWAGKPVMFVSDVLHYLNSTDYPICGIVNSDIHLSVNDSLISSIANLARGGFVFGPRVEVSTFAQIHGTSDPIGADFFFFDRKLVSAFPETHLCIGMPYWDIWYPLAALLEGMNTVRLVGQFAKHISHTTQRDDSFFLFADEFVQAIARATDGQSRNTNDRPLLQLRHALNRYCGLKQALLNQQAGNSPSTNNTLEKFARCIDEISRGAVQYTRDYAQQVAIG